MTDQQRLQPHQLPADSLVPIRTVSSMTGVNPVTLRAWERRYKLIRPTRTPKGHRLYSMADIALINQVVTLLEGGMAIGQVQQVINRAQQPPAADQKQSQQRFELWAPYQERMLESIQRFDENALDEHYSEILALYPIDVVTGRLIVPLLQELGWRWQRGHGTGVAEEHFFSVFLRNKLGARLHHSNRHQDGPMLLAACLPGEHHDVGLLLFTLVALEWNYRVVLLGANTPLDQLAAVAGRIAAQAIVLAAVVYPGPAIMAQLAELAPAATVPVFAGGRLTSRHGGELADSGIALLPDDFQQALRTINARLHAGVA